MLLNRVAAVFYLAFLVQSGLFAQVGPRLFLDFPSFYAVSTDVQRVANNVGLGTDLTMNVATHHSVLRLKGGSTFSLDPQSSDLLASLSTLPFMSLEAGVGRYRSNGNKCARTHRPAFTTMAKAGISHFFAAASEQNPTFSSTDFSLGAELGYFYIRDIIRNSELFMSGNYYLRNQVIQVEIGFRNFFNLRGRRD